jgi:hypothetical protein
MLTVFRDRAAFATAPNRPVSKTSAAGAAVTVSEKLDGVSSDVSLFRYSLRIVAEPCKRSVAKF